MNWCDKRIWDFPFALVAEWFSPGEELNDRGLGRLYNSAACLELLPQALQSMVAKFTKKPPGEELVDRGMGRHTTHLPASGSSPRH